MSDQPDESAELEVDIDETETAEEVERAAPVFDGPKPVGRPFAVGERILLIDRKKRRHLVVLADDGEFHSHSGVIPHAAFLGQIEGKVFRSTLGGMFRAFRPTMADYILKMKRGAQVIYPKDLGPILTIADIYPGVKVLESGIGSGALSMTLLRAGANIVGYEIRDDFARRAQRNVADYLGDGVLDRYDVSVRDVYEGIDEHDLDRIILDLPEPERVARLAPGALRPGGILVAYTPSITQSASLRHEMDAVGFQLCETIEVLNRGWYIEGQAVRPNHRMVAHTGFLTSGRWLPGDPAR